MQICSILFVCSLYKKYAMLFVFLSYFFNPVFCFCVCDVQQIEPTIKKETILEKYDVFYSMLFFSCINFYFIFNITREFSILF